MNTNLVKLGLAPLALIGCASCVNDDYDLSDIDTTSQIKVEDLVIPVNLDVITLGDIIEFDDDSKIKPITLNGKEFYALSETGDFKSEPIKIAKVSAQAPAIEPTEAYLAQFIPGLHRAPSIDLENGTITYEITEMGDQLHFDAENIDESIISIDHIAADITLTMTMQLLNSGDAIKSTILSDIVIQLPKGLEATTSDGSYDSATGRLAIDSKEISGNQTSIQIHATGIDFAKAGIELKNHAFSYDGDFKILSGYVSITPNFTGSLPETLHFRATYGTTDLVASAFTGTVNYMLDGLNIDPVSLGDIPDFLACEGTNISLANPQIYLQVNNPVADNNLECATGITLTAIREGGSDLSFSPDAPSFTIPCDKGSTGLNNFVLAPDQSSLTTPAQFSNDLNFVKFSTLGEILATPAGYPVSGLPQSIGISLDNPQIPTQHVTNFELGRELPAVEGNYELIAPLALSEESLIIYTETENGWNDDDVDAITISKLSLTATVTNNCPTSAELYAWPIDVNGNRINNVEVKSSTLKANSTDSPLTIEMSGEVKHLDGVIFEARLKGSSNNEALNPSQTIIIKNVRARVSGYYEKEF